MTEYTVDAEAEARLGRFLDQIGKLLNNKCRRASFASYATGLLGDGDRKSMEPIAARATGTDQRVGAEHQRLQHFITDSPWDDRAVRRYAASYVVGALQEQEPVETWIVDDTGFIKQGKHSVGVQRQYTGSAGKTTNCQLGVSLTLATATRHAPVDMELYLPRSWTDVAERRGEAKIPQDVQFRTKPELAIAMIDRALDDGLPTGVVLADCAYGTSGEFRDELCNRGLDYAVEVQGGIKVWRTNAHGRRRGEPLTITELAESLGRRDYRKLTWREGSQKALCGRFAFVQVLCCQDNGFAPAKRQRLWLVVEQRGPSSPDRTKYYLSTVPITLRKRWLVRMLKQRWRTERVYQDLKGQLGLDHFEGRRYRGWHHHVSVALSCYAFAAAEHARAFPPSA